MRVFLWCLYKNCMRVTCFIYLCRRHRSRFDRLSGMRQQLQRHGRWCGAASCLHLPLQLHNTHAGLHYSHCWLHCQCHSYRWRLRCLCVWGGGSCSDRVWIKCVLVSAFVCVRANLTSSSLYIHFVISMYAWWNNRIWCIALAHDHGTIWLGLCHDTVVDLRHRFQSRCPHTSCGAHKCACNRVQNGLHWWRRDWRKLWRSAIVPTPTLLRSSLCPCNT